MLLSEFLERNDGVAELSRRKLKKGLARTALMVWVYVVPFCLDISVEKEGSWTKFGLDIKMVEKNLIEIIVHIKFTQKRKYTLKRLLC